MSATTPIASAADLAGLAPQDWFNALEDVVEELGSYNFLGKHHTASFIEGGPKLLVTFESATSIVSKTQAAQPVGFEHIAEDGWSHLGIFAQKDGWFRDPKVFGYFDRLIDDGFFENFDEVLFFGADGGGYAACAYSVAAPGARVLAIRPQATLDPRVTGFDHRFKAARRQSFTGRYGYAPEMIDAAEQVSIIFDPLQRLDAVHAALFTKPHTQSFRCAAMGQRLDKSLDALGISAPLRRHAMDGTLNALSFAKLIRARRDDPGYLKRMLSWTEVVNRPSLSADICAHAIRSGHTKGFVEKLRALQTAGHRPSRPIEIEAAE
ncbi:MAG: phosphoadenosine phosphosulfate reductase [Pseudomonadota bacterium]